MAKEISEALRAYHRAHSRKHYLANKEKIKERSRAWHAAHPEIIRAAYKKYKAANKEKLRQRSRRYRAADPEKSRQCCRDWERRNGRAYHAQRRAAKLMATPQWLTREQLAQIASVYQQAVESGLTVDHIVPLKGKSVRGLHVPWNLQLLPGSLNYSKNNRFEDEV